MLTPNFFIKIHGLPKSVVIKSNQNNKVRIIRKFLSSKIYSKPRVSGPRYTQLGHKEACNLDCPLTFEAWLLCPVPATHWFL